MLHPCLPSYPMNLGFNVELQTVTFVQDYNSALAYGLISQFRLTSSNCGVVHSMISS